jgi:acid stress-induced BolA-like protein IbaG/YrbA
MLSIERFTQLIKDALPGAEVVVRDLTGGSNHFEARVVSAAFEGKSMLTQHRAVYAPLEPWLATGELHALALKTYTPAQWARAREDR